mmetsp:Transcript_2559/g.5483  ORF Transcript_2559/g.5483 Transcript_2559/m.5483 type:complete len:498 (+) Transcript_2559:161-1654(+)
MLFRGSLLLPLVLCTQGASAYFAPANNAHIELVSSGSSSAAVVENVESPELIESSEAVVSSLEDSLQSPEMMVLVESSGLSTSTVVEMFENWVEKFEKEYESTEEKSKRMMIWLRNHVMIESHNNKFPKPSFTLGHNPFSDLTHQEFRQQMRLGEFTPELIDHEEREFKFATLENKSKRLGNPQLRGVEDGAAVSRRLSEDDGESGSSSAGKSGDTDADSHDWTEVGVVGPIRNQGQCGACWAFSAIGAIESVMAIDKWKKLPEEKRAEMARDLAAGKKNVGEDLGLVIPLSEQDLIDCDTIYEHGCMGGLMTTTFQEEEVKKGICSEADYPYQMTQGTCATDLCSPVDGSIVKDKVDIVPRNTQALKDALKEAPVTAAMVASDPMFQFYSSGIFNQESCGKVTKQMGMPGCQMLYDDQDTCLPDINHGILVIGYGTDDSATDADVKDFFRVKNSWGEQWGEDGYFRLARFDEDKEDPLESWGMCGILTLLSYPVME